MVADDRPFTEAKTYFADAKFYLQCDAKLKETTKKESQKSKKRVLRYVPKSKRNQGQFPFVGYDRLKELTVPFTKIEVVKWKETILEGFVRPKLEPEMEQSHWLPFEPMKLWIQIQTNFS